MKLIPQTQRRTAKTLPRSLQQCRGLSMIEVLIAVLVLSIGLLGMAALQAVALSRTGSADQRSQAINLATELIDMVRANRIEALRYQAQFSPAGCDPEDAKPPTGIGSGSMAIPEREAWIARVRCVLPQAEGLVVVDNSAANGAEVTVTLTWTDARWAEDEEGDGADGDPPGLAASQSSFTMTSRI